MGSSGFNGSGSQEALRSSTFQERTVSRDQDPFPRRGFSREGFASLFAGAAAERGVKAEPVCVCAGADRLPAGGAARTGEPEEGPGEADQDAGVRPEAGEVRKKMPALHPYLVDLFPDEFILTTSFS